MKVYTGKTLIMVPWYDTDGMKQRTVIRLEGDVSKQSIIKGVQDYCLVNFNKKVSKQWILSQCPIMNDNDKGQRKVISHDTAFEQFIEDWIQEMEYDEAKGDTDTDDEESPTGEPAGEVRSLPNQHGGVAE